MLLVAVSGAVFLTLRLDRVVSFERLIDGRAALRDLVERHGLLSLLAFVLTYTAVAAFAVPGGLILNLTGGFLFGAIRGGLAAVVSATLGASILFLAARTLLHSLLRCRARNAIDRIRRGVQNGASSYMLSLCLSPLIPFWLVTVGAALADIPLRTFAWTTGLGILPVTFVATLAGANLDRVAAASQSALDACRAAGEQDCHMSLPWRDVISPSTLILLLCASLLALTPAALRAWRSGRRTIP